MTGLHSLQVLQQPALESSNRGAMVREVCLLVDFPMVLLLGHCGKQCTGLGGPREPDPEGLRPV